MRSFLFGLAATFLLLILFGIWALVLGVRAEEPVRRVAVLNADVLGTIWLRTVPTGVLSEISAEVWLGECRYFLASVVEPKLSWLQRRWLNGLGFKRAHQIVGEVAMNRAGEKRQSSEGSIPAKAAHCCSIRRTSLSSLHRATRLGPII